MSELPNVSESKQQVNPEEIDISSIPDALPVEDVKGLKSALEKLKQQVTELKGYKTKAQIVDELAAKGIDPKDIPARLAEVQNAETTQKEIERLIAEKEAQHNAEKEILERTSQETISVLQRQIRANQQRQTLESILARGGGSMNNYEDFIGLAQRHLVFDEKDHTKILSIKPPNTYKEGDAWWVEDEKQIGKVRPPTIDDFLIRAKNGEYGQALQSILPPLNQSSGSGLPNSVTLGGSGLILKRSDLSNISKLSPDQLAKVQKGEYTLIDG